MQTGDNSILQKSENLEKNKRTENQWVELGRLKNLKKEPYDLFVVKKPIPVQNN